jgi:tRNA dimethylallyltransferase
LFTKHDHAILVGGSGLYVDAVLKGFDYFPEVPIAIREQVQQNYSSLGLHYLQEQLKAFDATYYDKLAVENPQTLLNPQRMMRFVEVCLSTQKPYSSFLQQKSIVRPFVPILIGLEAERQVLYDRINKRVDVMMKSGLLQEVKSLYENKNLNALQTVGYRELFEYLDGSITLDQAIEEIKKNTRRFAKRQLTWFKRNENTKWFDYQTNEEVIIDYIQSIIQTKQTN